MMGPIGSFTRYETHRFPQVDGGQRDPRVLGRHSLVSEHRYTST